MSRKQPIREQDPLKQGLKQNILPVLIINYSIRKQDPLKQGLKLCKIFIIYNDTWIRKQDPLKQGLKQKIGMYWKSSLLIREQDPLKQGLKLFACDDDVFDFDSRARSTKTGIETGNWPSKLASTERFVSKIH